MGVCFFYSRNVCLSLCHLQVIMKVKEAETITTLVVRNIDVKIIDELQNVHYKLKTDA